MGLFPKDSSGQGFSSKGDDNKNDEKKDILKSIKDSVPSSSPPKEEVKPQETSTPTSPATPASAPPSTPPATPASAPATSSVAPKSSEEKPVSESPVAEEKPTISEEKKEPETKIEVKTEEKKEEVAVEAKPEEKKEVSTEAKPEEKKEDGSEDSESEEKKEVPKIEYGGKINPGSVKIAGLNASQDLEFDESLSERDTGEGSSETASEESETKSSVILSDSEEEELEDMSEKYFEKVPADSNPAGGVCLEELLDLCIDKEASDIHFSAEEKIGLRVNGKIHFINNSDELTSEQTRFIVFALVPNPLQRKKLFDTRELDTAYEHVKKGVNFRVNIFFKRGKLAAVLRRIASHAFTLEQLGVPVTIKELLNAKQGLLLVTGPTGSGKSTSMQSMLELINQKRVEHILTIEDPIEYIFQSQNSIFSQREVGPDTHCFANALKAALREDPDIVMIGEMRDAETIQAAMNLSETGHLVISTLHTSSAPQTISRLVSNFPSSEQEQVQSRLADSLLGVLSQRLVSRADREGRVGIYELMIVNAAIRNIIRTGDMAQIHNAMLAGREVGMVLMQDFAANLDADGIIDEESYIHFFREE